MSTWSCDSESGITLFSSDEPLVSQKYATSKFSLILSKSKTTDKDLRVEKHFSTKNVSCSISSTNFHHLKSQRVLKTFSFVHFC